MDAPAAPPAKYGVLLLTGFQALDIFRPLAPLDTLKIPSRLRPLGLSILVSSMEPVSTAPARGGFGQPVVPTHTFDGAPADPEVLLIPGGRGTWDATLAQPAVNFLRDCFPGLRWLLTVCTGSALAVEAGVLDGSGNRHDASVADQYGEDDAQTLATAAEDRGSTDACDDPLARSAGLCKIR